MSAKRRRSGHAGGGHEEGGGGMERWLLTYADMITLLLALFVVLFSMASIQPIKFKLLSQSLAVAFNQTPRGDTILNPGHGVHNVVFDASDAISSLQQAKDSAQAKNKSLQQQNQDLQKALQSNNNAQYAASQQQLLEILRNVKKLINGSDTLRSQVEVRVDGRGLVLRVLPDKVLFASGVAVLRPQAATLLDPLAQILKLQPNAIRVEGHTDNQPIHTAQFPSNWELSTARAASVVHYLIQHGVPATHLSAAGFADTHPVASNETISGRAKNRRIEIIVLRRGESTN